MLVTQSCPTLCDPMDYTPPGSSVHGILQEEYWSGLPFPSPGDLPDPGIEPGLPARQADSLLSEPQGSPRFIDVGSQSRDATFSAAVWEVRDSCWFEDGHLLAVPLCGLS